VANRSDICVGAGAGAGARAAGFRLLSSALLLLAGCGLASERIPVRDPAVAGTATVSERPVADARPSVAAPNRAERQGPLTLDEAIALAFEQNPDLGAAAERIGQAEARVGEATSAFFPQISTRLSYTRTDNPAQAFGLILAQRRFSSGIDFNHPGTIEDVRPEIVGALPLFRGGQDFQRRAAAALGVEAARLDRDTVRNALADAVVAAYYALLTAPEHVEVTRTSIDAVESALAQARARYEAGTALKSDTLSLEVRLAAAREANVRAHNAVELARAGLRILLGLSADAPVEVMGTTKASPSVVPADFTEALTLALAHRPEIEAAARVVAMREHELRAERAAYLPRIDAVASYGQDNTTLEFSRRQDNWMVGATAELDLFSGFRTVQRVRAAKGRLAEARQEERKTRLEIEREVKTAVLSYQEASERARVTEAAIAAAEEALRLVEAQYQAGAVTITRYLETEVARMDARSHAIAARYDARRTEAGLRKAMGLWAEGNRQ
jgi:outer membrane protein TolC